MRVFWFVEGAYQGRAASNQPGGGSRWSLSIDPDDALVSIMPPAAVCTCVRRPMTTRRERPKQAHTYVYQRRLEKAQPPVDRIDRSRSRAAAAANTLKSLRSMQMQGRVSFCSFWVPCTREGARASPQPPYKHTVFSFLVLGSAPLLPIPAPKSRITRAPDLQKQAKGSLCVSFFLPT